MSGCWNRSGGTWLVTTASCRSDLPGQTLDIQAAGADGVVRSLLTAPIACTVAGASGILIAQPTYPNEGVLNYVFTVTAPATPALLLALVRTQPLSPPPAMVGKADALHP